jgi:hypothetical protein
VTSFETSARCADWLVLRDPHIETPVRIPDARTLAAISSSRMFRIDLMRQPFDRSPWASPLKRIVNGLVVGRRRRSLSKKTGSDERIDAWDPRTLQLAHPGQLHLQDLRGQEQQGGLEGGLSVRGMRRRVGQNNQEKSRCRQVPGTLCRAIVWANFEWWSPQAPRRDARLKRLTRSSIVASRSRQGHSAKRRT